MTQSNSRMAVFAVMTLLASCSSSQRVSHDAGDFSAGTVSVAAFDPQEFLCQLSGGVASPVRNPLNGRRFTLEERARAREKISSELQRFGLDPAEQYVKVSLGGSAVLGYDGQNLMAVLRSDVPSDDWIIVGAHYDTVRTSSGADDNASGVTAVLMVAEALAQQTHRSKNVLFIFFDLEEEGLIGSYFFAQRLPAIIPSAQSIIAVHIVDMAAWDSDRDRAVELSRCYGDGDEQQPPVVAMRDLYQRALDQLLVWQEEPSPSAVRDYEMCRSDHVPFSELGLPAIHVGEEFNGGDMSPYYHQPTDTCDTLDFTFLHAVANLVTEAVRLEL